MSEYIDENLKKQYPTLNFNVQLKIPKLTQEEIEEYTGKKQEAKDISKTTTNLVPKIYIRQDIQIKTKVDEHITQEGGEDTDTSGDDMNKKIIPQDTNDELAMDLNATQEGEEDLDAADDGMDKRIIPQATDDELAMDLNATQEVGEDSNAEDYENDERIIPQDTNDEPAMDLNATQEGEEDLDAADDGMDKRIIPEYLENGFMSYPYVVAQDVDNPFLLPNPYLPIMVTPQDIQNSGNMDIDTVPGSINIYNPSYCYNENIKIKQEIPDDSYYAAYPPPGSVDIYKPEIRYNENIRIKQEIPDDSYYATYPMQEAGCSSSMHNDFSPVVVKQEVFDEGYNDNYITQENQEMYNTENEYAPNINQPTENIGNMPNYIQPENSPFMIKQEILDDGNIEILTDVLKPSTDQEYEGVNSL